MSIQEEQNLLDDFNKKDEKAISRVYKLFYEGMLIAAKGILKQKEEAEDIVSFAFEKLLMSGKVFESMYKLKCYVYVIVKHKCFHENEKFMSFKRTKKDYYSYMSNLSTNQGLCKLLDNDNHRLISHLMKGINSRDANIIYSWYFLNKSGPEIGKVINLSQDHVRVSKSRALLEMRKKIKSQ